MAEMAAFTCCSFHLAAAGADAAASVAPRPTRGGQLHVNVNNRVGGARLANENRGVSVAPLPPVATVDVDDIARLLQAVQGVR
jgi:hypothetical protein